MPGSARKARRAFVRVGSPAAVLFGIGMLAAFGHSTGIASQRVVSSEERTVLVGATLVDGNGGAPMVGARIVMQHGLFACVSGPAGCPSRPGDHEIDLTGQWITPGLIDTHVHLPFASSLPGLMRAQRLRFALGITTVRDAGSRSTNELLAARTLAEQAASPIPRIVVASRVEEADASRLQVALGAPVVERLAALGVEAIKIKPPFDREIWREEIRAARRAGIPVFGHTWAGQTEDFTREAIAEGISGISHIMGLVLAVQPAGAQLTPPGSEDAFWQWEKALWLTVDSAQVDTLFREMIAANVWLEPTLASEYHFGRPLLPPRQAEFLDAAPSLRAMFLGGGPTGLRPAPVFPAAWPRQAAFVREFVRRGGIVVAGSDGLSPGVDLHEEIALIAEATGSPMIGLQAATRNAALALNHPEVGTVVLGQVGDAVVYPRDPLEPSDGTLLPSRVIKGGVLFDGDSLRAEFRDEYDDRVQLAWRARGLRLAQWSAGIVALLSVLYLPLRVFRQR